MDNESNKLIRMEGFCLNYRFSSEVMRPYKPKTTPHSGTSEMLVDKEATHSGASTAKQAATVVSYNEIAIFN